MGNTPCSLRPFLSCRVKLLGQILAIEFSINHISESLRKQYAKCVAFHCIFVALFRYCSTVTKALRRCTMTALVAVGRCGRLTRCCSLDTTARFHSQRNSIQSSSNQSAHGASKLLNENAEALEVEGKIQIFSGLFSSSH